MIGFTYGTVVVSVPYRIEDQIPIELGKEIEATDPITICVRFKFKRQIRNRIIFSGNNNNLRLTFRTDTNYGGFTQSAIRNIFAIPKDSLKPYKWHHLCVNSDKKSYRSGFLK